MSRSLFLAFLMALIPHALLTLVELDTFNRPIYVKVPLKTLTMDIVGPRPVKKHSVVKIPSIVVRKSKKKPILEKKIIRNARPKLSVKPRIEDKKRIQPKKIIIKEEPPKKHETLAELSPADFPAIKKKEDVFEEDTAFVPDMVDIPRALRNIKDTPDKVKKEWVPGSLSDVPIAYALPIYKSNISPQYPLLARKRGYQGTVLLEVLVNKDGKAASIRLARSSGYETLDRAAIKGVENWLFHPAKRGDELVEMWVKIPIRFKLK